MTRRRYVQIDGVLHEVGRDYIPEPRMQTHQVMPDIQPYRSMIDGSIIGSRSTHREHLRAHGCIEVGNETQHLLNRAKPIEPPPGRKELLIQLANEKLRHK